MLSHLLRFHRYLSICWAVTVLTAASVGTRAANVEDPENRAAADALFTNGTVLVLKIEVPPAVVNSLRRNPRTYVRATLREGPRVHSNVLVRIKGSAGSFRPWDDKPGLTLKLEDTNHARFHGLKKFHLNNSVQDPTFLSEWLCSELFREAGVPTPRVAHALVELNGRRMGLYVLLENVNQDFLSRYFNNTKGNVYSQGWNADVTAPLEKSGGKEDDSREDLRSLAIAAREAGASRLAQVLDLDRFLSFLAMEVILDHWDGYSFNVKNYFVYHDLDSDRMVFMPHDMDQMLQNANREVTPQTKGIVARAILRVPETRQRYLARMNDLSTNVFVAAKLTRRIDDLVARITPMIAKYDPQLSRNMITGAGNLKNRVVRRERGLAAQLQRVKPVPLPTAGEIVSLSGWSAAGEDGVASLTQGRDPSGKSVLVIATRATTTASWRLKVSLNPGDYVFEGQGRSVDIEPLPADIKGEGAGLRISGSQTPRANQLVGTSNWTPLAYEFQVTPEMREVELICELRASRGRVWFDAESLRLRRQR